MNISPLISCPNQILEVFNENINMLSALLKSAEAVQENTLELERLPLH